MASNLYRKINETIARNCIRPLQSNAQKPTQASNALEEISRPQVEKQKFKKFSNFAISSQYRTTPPENPSLWANSFEPERDILERNLENQFLQPATLPSYKDQPIFDNQFMASLQEEQIHKAQLIATNNSASQRILESFKQKKAKNLPTRLPKLTSNPFPEPLKAIFSPFTLSDQEKAEQMYQDQRMAFMKHTSDCSANSTTTKSSKKFYSSTPLLRPTQEITGQGIRRFNSVGLISRSSDRVRFFSKKNKGSEVCVDKSKSGKPEKPRKCHKITIKGCPPVRANTICKQKNKEVNCKKVEAPYPSFSESCYMEPKGRTKECEICPWNEKTNPNFKGKLKIPPKFYHTDCFPSSSVSNDSGSALWKNYKNQAEHKNPAQIWVHKANLSQVYNMGKKLPAMDFFSVSKSSEKNRLPIGVFKSRNIVDEDKGKVIQAQTPLISETTKIGYCEKNPTALTQFFMKNGALLRNFRNGDDLSEFGVEKSALSRILSSSDIFDVVCKKGDRIIPDYPRNCNKTYHDETKKCPSGLTRRKSKKDRLKRKQPKDIKNPAN